MAIFERLLNAKNDTTFNMAWNDMIAETEGMPFSVVFDGPWGFEYTIAADQLQEARGTARAFIRQYPDTERYEIWRRSRRVESCDLVPPSDDDRALQSLGWPNASEGTHHAIGGRVG